MDARPIRFAFLALAAWLVLATVADGAVYRTQNFVVTAEAEAVAQQVGDLAEKYRDELAVEWLGHKLPRWFRPCPITVKVGQIGAGGATSFVFDKGEVFGWKMNIQGSLERILDSVLPHEVSHTIFACHFRRPLPRWADEGAATLVEHESERRRQTLLLDQVLNTSQRIPLRSLLAMTEYPKGMDRVLTLYAEGYSLASFLVQRGGKAHYLRFLDDAHHRGWDDAIRAHYRFAGIDSLEQTWTNWIIAGSPNLPEDERYAATEGSSRTASGSAGAGGSGAASAPVVRAQNDDRLDRPAGANVAAFTGTTVPSGSELAAPSPRRGGVSAGASAAADPAGRGHDVLVASEGTRRTSSAGWIPPNMVRPVYVVPHPTASASDALASNARQLGVRLNEAGDREAGALAASAAFPRRRSEDEVFARPVGDDATTPFSHFAP